LKFTPNSCSEKRRVILLITAKKTLPNVAEPGIKSIVAEDKPPSMVEAKSPIKIEKNKPIKAEKTKPTMIKEIKSIVADEIKLNVAKEIKSVVTLKKPVPMFWEKEKKDKKKEEKKEKTKPIGKDETTREFHPFNELPAEIRVIIWTMASTKPRLVHYEPDKPGRRAKILNKEILVALDSVNREAHTIFRSHTTLHEVGGEGHNHSHSHHSHHSSHSSHSNANANYSPQYRSAAKALDVFYITDYQPFGYESFGQGRSVVVDQRFFTQKIVPPLRGRNRYDHEIFLIAAWYKYRKITFVLDGYRSLPVQTALEDLRFGPFDEGVYRRMRISRITDNLIGRLGGEPRLAWKPKLGMATLKQ
jgi:hypothetical protein